MISAGWYADGNGVVRDSLGNDVTKILTSSVPQTDSDRLQGQYIANKVMVDGKLRATGTVNKQLYGDRSYIPVQSILGTIEYGKRSPDPQGIPGFYMYTSSAVRIYPQADLTTRTSVGRLEVLVNESNFTIAHVMFKSDR
jgi:hypothetical protein